MNYYYVYILTNKNNSVLYVGFTNDIIRRVEKHKNKVYEGFTKFYNVSKLLYFEKHLTCEEAMKRESQMKKWNRTWKEKLINKYNPEWKDLSEDFNDKLTPLEILDLIFNNGIN